MKLTARLLFASLLLASLAGAALAHALLSDARSEGKDDASGSLSRASRARPTDAPGASDRKLASRSEARATALGSERVTLRAKEAWSGAPSKGDAREAGLLAATQNASGGTEPGSAGSAPAARRTATLEQKEKVAAALAQVDWSSTLKDMVAAMKARRSGSTVDMDVSVEYARVNLALTEAAQALGLPYPQAALGDPTVRAAIVPAWLDALGVNLDAAQAAQISSSCLALPPGAAATSTFLAAKQAALQSRIALEQSLATVLSPDQMDTYAKNVALDPLMKPGAAQLALSARSQTGLAAIVADYWSNSFKLDAGSKAAAQTVASQYVAAALAVPAVAPNLDPQAARLAVMDRTNQLIQLQAQAEQTLAASSTLSADERTRAQAGSTKYLRLAIPR